MTPEEIRTVRASFAHVAAMKVEAAALFYGRLFKIAPEVRPLFTGDLNAQGSKLMAALSYLVAALDRLDDVAPFLEELAQRHVGFGVERSHYERVGEALLWTLRQALGPAFTHEVAAAWANAYGRLAAPMIEAAYGDAMAA